MGCKGQGLCSFYFLDWQLSGALPLGYSGKWCGSDGRGGHKCQDADCIKGWRLWGAGEETVIRPRSEVSVRRVSQADRQHKLG